MRLNLDRKSNEDIVGIHQEGRKKEPIDTGYTDSKVYGIDLTAGLEESQDVM